ncbi:DNA-processing protein DprA [Leifsonia sp. NPDC058230]|uniref:DNA-processing protein DprA n=1 Tax=Leifsonia sp. NPDC058230 TaxID=3346391 RepID=UPI0036D848A9
MTRLLELDNRELHRILAPVTPPALGVDLSDATGLTNRFATAALSTLVEPGDTDAALVIATLGASTALTAIVERWATDRILRTVAEIDEGAAAVLGGRSRARGPRDVAPPTEEVGPVTRLDEALERWLPRLSLRASVRSLEAAANVGAVFVIPDDELWPTGFGDLGEGAPIGLWVRGRVESLTACDRSIALVGARAATGYGEHVAMESAAGLADRGFAVVSGGAYGIDGAAHRAALASDQTTIAFLAGGVDRLYPAGHTALLTRIAEHGLLVGELPCGSSPTKWRFLQRNRLIAAASRATVVVEAGRRSGSLNTAGHAAAIGRPLGAVPGPVTSPASAGCHRLIQEYGAACVTSAAEMAELTGIAEPLGDVAGAGSVDGVRLRVLDALSPRTPRTVREVATRAGMSERDAISTLGLLDVESLASEREAGWIKAPPQRER